MIAFSLVTSVLIARILGPEGRGLYAVATAVGALGVQFGNMGLHSSNTYFVAKNRTLLPSLLGNTIMVSFCLGGLLAGFAWAIFSLMPEISPLKGFLLPLALSWIPVGLMYFLLQSLLIGVKEIRTYNKIEAFNGFVFIVLIFVLIFIKNITVESVYVANLVGLIVSVLFILWGLRLLIDKFPVPSMRLFFENIRYGIKAYLAAFFAFIVLRIDLLMVKYILGAKEAGYYSVAASMADLVYLLPTTVGMIIFPHLSEMENDRDRWIYARRVVSYLALTLAVVIALAMILAKPFVRLLFGQAFLPAVPAFIILGVAIFFYGVNNILSIFLASIAFPWFAVNIWIVVAILNILMNLYMIEAFGIIGASLSSLFCYFILMISQYFYIARRRIVAGPTGF
jgi:O-antigen/teichoic acid export membrane protein